MGLRVVVIASVVRNQHVAAELANELRDCGFEVIASGVPNYDGPSIVEVEEGALKTVARVHLESFVDTVRYDDEYWVEYMKNFSGDLERLVACLFVSQTRDRHATGSRGIPRPHSDTR